MRTCLSSPREAALPHSIEAMAHRAFRSGQVSPELQRFARAQIEHRGLRPIADCINAQIDRAYAVAAKRDEAA
jgi:hypothetical protein